MTPVSDGIINHENEELRDRVMTLEKKVQQQEDEIVCLKSALSDVIRRLSSVEAGRGEFMLISIRSLHSYIVRSTRKYTTMKIGNVCDASI